MHRILAVLCLSVLFATPAQANEQLIRQTIEPKLNGGKIDGVQPGPVPGLFEVRFRSSQGVQILYTDAKAENIIVGNIYESKTDRNLTEERIARLSAIKFDSLPLDQAVKIVRGNGKRVMAMFSDPYCPACQSFEQVLQQVDDLTLYVFMFPVIRPERADHSKSVWCSPDRAKAWLDLALRKKVSGASPACDNPVEKIVNLGQTIGVRATPTVFFQNGERVQGGLPIAALRARLEEASGARQAKK
ncbi:MAG: DsbC family protein [Betaproteobacteria bacterium]|nr:DsbC family protein [Betaproteobacteria bacterium]